MLGATLDFIEMAGIAKRLRLVHISLLVTKVLSLSRFLLARASDIS